MKIAQFSFIQADEYTITSRAHATILTCTTEVIVSASNITNKTRLAIEMRGSGYHRIPYITWFVLPVPIRVLSWKFRSAENFGPGPVFSENFGPVGPILSENKRSVS